QSAVEMLGIPRVDQRIAANGLVNGAELQIATDDRYKPLVMARRILDDIAHVGRLGGFRRHDVENVVRGLDGRLNFVPLVSVWQRIVPAYPRDDAAFCQHLIQQSGKALIGRSVSDEDINHVFSGATYDADTCLLIDRIRWLNSAAISPLYRKYRKVVLVP